MEDDKKNISNASTMTETQRANLPARTTVEQDKKSKGQRDINMIWETTQRNLAMFVVASSNLVSAFVVIRGVMYGVSDASLVIAAFTLLSSSNFLVAGFYFGRTNHSRIGDEIPKGYKATNDSDEKDASKGL